MALTVDNLSPMPQPSGHRVIFCDITFDSSYPTGGEAVGATELATLGLASITHLLPGSANLDAKGEWDSANSKLMLRVVSTGAEAANASDQSATVLKGCCIVGPPALS